MCFVGSQQLSLGPSSVPTQDQVLVPETLPKKRKSQGAARAETEAKKKAGSSLQMQFLCICPFFHLHSNNLMKTPTTRLDQRSMLAPDSATVFAPGVCTFSLGSS